MGTIHFKQTCQACPEQYDVFYHHTAGDVIEIGYVRLRHGKLTLSKEPLGEVFYTQDFNTIDGCFDNEQQRWQYFTIMSEVLIKHYGYHDQTLFTFTML